MPCLAHSRSRRTPSRLRTVLVAALIGSVICSTAQARGIIRDAETEALIRDYAKPIFRAAGVGSQNIRIHIVNDRNFNAFVVDGHNMFMHAGALMIAETPNQTTHSAQTTPSVPPANILDRAFTKSARRGSTSICQRPHPEY